MQAPENGSTAEASLLSASGMVGVLVLCMLSLRQQVIEVHLLLECRTTSSPHTCLISKRAVEPKALLHAHVACVATSGPWYQENLFVIYVVLA